MWPWSFSGSPGPQETHFERQYACYPVSFAGREALEKGNKILLPQSALNTLARLNVTWPMLFRVSNSALNRETHSGVLEFSAEEGACYMPYWMMKNLIISEGDIVKVVNTSLPKGSYVKLQPVTMDFLDISDHRAVLEHSLRHFATLTVGDNIVVQHNNKSYEIEILECRPGKAISIIETDVQVDFAPPKDYVEPPRNLPQPQQQPQSLLPPAPSESPATTQSEQSTLSPDPKPSFSVFGGAGVRLDGRPANRTASSASSSSSSSSVKQSRPNPRASALPEMVEAEAESGGEDAVNSEEPWNTKYRLPGGVRTSCVDYSRLILEGKLPGLIGKTRVPHHQQLTTNPQQPSEAAAPSAPFVLFGGEGHCAQ